MTEAERAARSDAAYKDMRKQLDDALKKDNRLAKIAEKIKAGKANFTDTAEYSELVAKHLSGVIQNNIGTIKSSAGIRMVCDALLKDHYESINDVLGQVQTVLDEQNGIHLRPQAAAYPAERVHTLTSSLTDPTVAAQTILRRAGAPVENVAKSMHDDYMEKNAKFRSDAGLKCWIVRTTDGKCCSWCTSIAGRYEYGKEPQSVYRRHDNCGCTVVYESGRTRQYVWSKKSWSQEEERAYLKELDAKKKAKRLSPQQGRETEQRNLSQITRFSHAQGEAVQGRNLRYRGLTSGGGSGIIKSIDVDDYELVTYGKNIAQEVSNVIIETMRRCERNGKFVISEISTAIVPTTTRGTPVLQIEPTANGLLRLNVNAEYLSGKTLEEINIAFLNTDNTVVNSLEEAVIHESGHAISISGKSSHDVKKLYDELKDKGLPGVSEIALKDGAECLAELEVLRHRGTIVSTPLAEFYKKYMGRDY